MDRLQAGHMWQVTWTGYRQATCGGWRGQVIDRPHVEGDMDRLQTDNVWRVTWTGYRQATCGGWHGQVTDRLHVAGDMDMLQTGHMWRVTWTGYRQATCGGWRGQVTDRPHVAGDVDRLQTGNVMSRCRFKHSIDMLTNKQIPVCDETEVWTSSPSPTWNHDNRYYDNHYYDSIINNRPITESSFKGKPPSPIVYHIFLNFPLAYCVQPYFKTHVYISQLCHETI